MNFNIHGPLILAHYGFLMIARHAASARRANLLYWRAYRALVRCGHGTKATALFRRDPQCIAQRHGS